MYAKETQGTVPTAVGKVSGRTHFLFVGLICGTALLHIGLHTHLHVSTPNDTGSARSAVARLTGRTNDYTELLAIARTATSSGLSSVGLSPDQGTFDFITTVQLFQTSTFYCVV